ncbi:MAG: hypothetical protein KDD38_01875 [Bdellovibrionales bacterium]|nr:hypothetical protein [Bdellovibrionales bacterium]
MSHTARARDILAAIKFLPEDVVQIIYDCLDASEGRSHGRLGPLSAASFASYQFMNYMGESGTDELEPRMNQALAKMKESGQDHVGDYAVALENVLFGVDSKI